MPPITALLHTLNDEDRIGRTLESLHACDEILIIDGGSTDDTLRIARQYGATVRKIEQSGEPGRPAAYAWVLCLLPNETVSDTLESSLYEWKLYSDSEVAEITAGSVFLREETGHGWGEAIPETRLVRREWAEWEDGLPKESQSGMRLQGDLLRFRRT